MLKKLNKINLTIAILLAFVSGVNAQSVTVPQNCFVVGLNGSLGPGGGTVTDGGVVIMPDDATPNGGGVFTFNAPTVPNNPVLTPGSVIWRLKGDLSSSTSTGFGSPTQPANGLLSAFIKSYNKQLSNNESISPSDPKFARSKGKVTVSYTLQNNGTPCGASISFDIYKSIPANAYLPSIVGPPCVQAGVECSFQVDAIASDNSDDEIGFDKYYWSELPALVNGTQIGFSADKSAIKFTPATDASFTLKCCIGRANPWDGGITNTRALTGTNCVTKAINGAMAEPLYTTNPNALCVPTSADAAFTINYPVSNYTYQWSTPTVGWTIGTQTSASVAINTNGYHNPGILNLDIIGCNKSRRFTYNIKRSLAAPVVIAPVIAGNNCLQQQQYSNPTQFAISESAAGNPIAWSLSPSGVGVGIQAFPPNSSTVNVYVPLSAPQGIYTLTARTTACPSGSITHEFRVFDLKTYVGAVPCLVKGDLNQKTYTCHNVLNATSYTWTFPAGWGATTSFTTPTNQITVTPSIDANAVLNGVATVVANSSSAGCTGPAASFNINYTSTAPAISGSCFSVGTPSTATVSIANPTPGGTYSAFLYPTVNGIPNVSSNLVTSPVTLEGNILKFSTSALTASTPATPTTPAKSYNLTISHNGLCGGPAPTTIPVTVVGNGATVSRATATNPNRDIYTAVAPAGMINPQYEWYACTPASGCTIISGANAATLTLSGTNAPPANSQICVEVFPFGSPCKTRVCAAQGQYSVMATTNAKNIVSVKDIGNAIYPNPNTGTFNIKIGDFKKSATATLYDISGRKIKDFKLVKGINKIENEKLSLGNYLVVLYIDGKKEVKKIVIK